MNGFIMAIIVLIIVFVISFFLIFCIAPATTDKEEEEIIANAKIRKSIAVSKAISEITLEDLERAAAARIREEERNK